MRVVMVAGALANKYRNGGGAWERMSWVVGLKRLGFDVWFIEQIAAGDCVDADGKPTTFEMSANLGWFRSMAEWFGVSDRAALICGQGEQSVGASRQQLLETAKSAELLVNLSGHLTLEPLLRLIRRKAYVDVDPGFTQFWHADPQLAFRLPDHDFYFTVGENIGTSDCAIPTGGVHWRPTRQPVVLADWPVTAAQERDRFTTIGSWRGAFGPVTTGDRVYGLKVHEFRKFMSLPRQFDENVPVPIFEAALDIHPADAKDIAALKNNGWRLIDPKTVAAHPAEFRRYVQQSAAEWSVAQGIYVDTNSGWFSDRSIRYLASGKPVLVQDTGFSRLLPAGAGLVPFRTLEEAVAGAKSILRDYDAHCEAARKIAETCFDSDAVLSQLIEAIGVRP